ncbi:uncharacterized protein LOC131058357 [Cryptomeria japonica]|uniref:uncharacterized protein LOC131058357 n=1 Tax=Cryptomeria japonica TaxID=3369 RepID=UPI0027DA3E8D|nr:uncharacterized protein LOC131058357 [Cryptomeria japonica]
MAFSDLFDWISHLPHPPQWRRSVQSVRLFKLVEFSAQKKGEGRICFSIDVTSWRTIPLGEFSCESMEVTTSCLFSLFIKSISHVLQNIKELGKYIELQLSTEDLAAVPSYLTQSANYPLLFNSAFLCLCLLVMSPVTDRLYPQITQEFTQLTSPEFVSAIGAHLEAPLMRFLGAYFSASFTSSLQEEPFHSSYACKISDLWKVGVYCPIVCMKAPKSHHKLCNLPQATGKLGDALRYQQLESIIQLSHTIHLQEEPYIKLEVGIDNLRCDVYPFQILQASSCSDVIATERYFPSRISLSITPQLQQGDDFTISVPHSSPNPSIHNTTRHGLELSFQSPNQVGVKRILETETSFDMKFWKFDQFIQETKGTFTWILYNPVNKTEVISSKPPKYSFLDAKPWYKDRYRKPYSPFNNQGGVVFADDTYGRKFSWRLNRKTSDEVLKLNIEGTIWLTYWPNVYNTSFYETRSHEFCEQIEILLVKS